MAYISEDDEEKLLGSMLYNNSSIPDIQNIITGDDFYNDINGKLYKMICKIYGEGKRVDIAILHSEFAPIYGNEYSAKIATLTDTVGNGRNAETYAKTVLSYSQKRKAAIITQKIADAPPGLVSDELINATGELVQLQNRSAGGRTTTQIKDIMVKCCDQFEKNYKNGGIEIGSSTCFNAINSILHGIKNELVIIGARPSIGKTALCTSLIIDQAKKKNKVAFFSCEMSEDSIGYRMVASMSGINAERIKGGWVKDLVGQTAICNAMGDIAELPIVIDDHTYEIHDICARAMYLVRCEGVNQIYIDHFSRVTNRSKLYSEQEKAKEKMFLLANLRKDLKIPIIVLFQLTRDAEGKRPRLNDLRETGASEQDADVVAFLHREREIVDDGQGIMTKFIVEKNRDGRIGESELYFYPNIATYKDK
jgi:replicative DNA helicase